MESDENEDKLLRSVALQNANSILLARQRAEQELIGAKEALERKTGQLAYSLAMMRATLESTTDAILVTDEGGKVTGYNQKFVEMWRLPSEVMDTRQHRQLLEVTSQQFKEPKIFRSRIEEIYAASPPDSFDVLDLADGRVLERFSKIQFIGERNVGRVWSFRDITERKRAEEQLRQQREWFQVTLSSIGDAVLTTDTQGKITFLNPVAEKMTGWKLGEASGQHLEKVFNAINEKTRQPTPNPVHVVLREGIIVGLANHTALVARDGTETAIEDSAAPIRDANGNISGAVMVFHDVTQRRRAEGALRESEERLRATFNQAAVGMVIAGLDGRFLELNQKFADILGYPSDELQRLTFAEVTHPDDLPLSEAQVRRLLDGVIADFALEKRYLRKDGAVVWSLTTVTLLKDATGQPKRFIALIEDITVRRKAEESLQARERELSLIYSNVSDGIFYLAAESQENFRFLSVNQAFLAASWLAEPQVVGRLIQEVLPESSRLVAIENCRKAIREGGTVRWEETCESPAGTKVSAVSVTPIFDPGKACRNLIGSIHDITERKRSEEVRFRLAAVVESSDDAIVSKSLDGIISTWNQGAERMFGFAAAEVIGKPVTILIPTARLEEESVILEKLQKGQRIEHYETERMRKDGTILNVSLTVSPIKDASGKIIGASKIARDITQRKRAEEELRQAQEKLSRHAEDLETQVAERTATLRETIGELEAFSYSISHDLRAPLRAMQSFALILAEECASQVSPEGKGYIRRIVTAAERLDRLIQDVLSYSRVARAELPLEPVDIEKLLRDILESYPIFHASVADIRLESSFPRVLATQALLTQCISNLLGNAVKFVADGVTPCVRIWAETVGEGQMVRLFFKDNGLGIDQDAHETIFGIFQRVSNRYEGMGIGLAIVKKGVERMGGTVGLESELGHGSTFWLELKRANNATE